MSTSVLTNSPLSFYSLGVNLAETPNLHVRNQVVAAIMILLVIASAGAGYLVGKTSQRTITSTSVSISVSTLPVVTTYTALQTSAILQTVTSFSTTATNFHVISTQTVTTGCANSSLGVTISAPASYNASELGYLALVMNPGTNATIFVGYCPLYVKVPSALPSPSVNIITCYGGPATGGGCSGTPAKGVTIAPVPSQALFEDDSMTIVSYFVSVDTNSTGFYSIYIPYMCPSAGLDVGYPPSWLNHSDFPWMGFPPCPYSFGEILSVSGANMTYVSLGYGIP